MGFELEFEDQRVRDEARAVARTLERYAVEAEESNEVHPGVLQTLRDSGLFRLMVPATYGGFSDQIDPLRVCLVREALMATSSHADSLFALQGIGSFALAMAGSDSLRRRWLPGVAEGSVLAALAITEPGAGSDLKAITTAVHRHGSGLVLRGSKSFISNAGAAAFYSVLAREGDVGLSMFLIPADAEGVSVTPVPELIAPHVLGDVEFRDVALDESLRLGQPGEGLELVLSTLSVFRVSVAGAAVGLAQAALEEAVRHTRSRTQFGRPLIRLGPVAQLLADSWTEVEMARLLAYSAASSARRDPRAGLGRSSMAKLGATEAASRVVDRCVQVMGRFGLVRNTKIERLYRQARPMRIYEGASEVLRLGIAADLAKEIS